MAAVGFGLIGGFMFGPIGFAIGSLIGNLLFPQKQEGPRLTDLKLNNSAYGAMIPIVYASMRVPAIVIWQTDLMEHSHSSGGKGGPDVVTYSYSASFAAYLCEGPIVAVNKIWADGILIFDITNPDLVVMPCVLYLGDETQGADPTMEGVLGAGNVPGYRGKAYVVFDDWDLTTYGNRIPNLNFEVVANEPPGELVIVKQNTATGHTFSGGPVVFSKWDLTQTDFAAGRVQNKNPNNANGSSPLTLAPTVVPANFLNTNLSYDSPNTDGFEWGYASDWFSYAALGYYVYADGHKLFLWSEGYRGTSSLPPADRPHLLEVRNSLSDPPIATGASVVANWNGGGQYGNVVDSINFLYDAGVTAGVFLRSVVLSADGTALWAFTSTVSATSDCDTWWKIVDGTVTATGTITPTVNFDCWGQSGTWRSAISAASILNVGMFENNGIFMWYFNPTALGIYIYKLDSLGNLADWGSGTLSLPFATNPFTIPICETGMIIPQNGYAGFGRSSSMFLVTRIQPDSSGIPLSEIVSDISVRAGLSTMQIDVTQLTDLVDGYIISQQQDCRSSITPLQSAYYFDAVESSGVVKFVKRGGPIEVTIPDNDLAAQAGAGGTPPAIVTAKRVQEVDLPAIFHVKYINGAAAYQTGDQMSQRQVTSSQHSYTLELSINMSDTKGKQIANTLLFNGWVEREQLTFLTSRKYDYLEPTDVVGVHGYEVRIMNKSDVASGIIQFDGVACVSNLWTQGPTAAIGTGNTTPTTPTLLQPTKFFALDIPLLVDTDNQMAFYAAMAGSVDTTWRGANVYKSADMGTTYTQVASSSGTSVLGQAASVLGDFGGGNIFDEGNSVTVVIGVGGGSLSSATELAVLNGANLALLGPELIQYKNAVLSAPSTYVLSGLLRGRRGTEWAIPNHQVGDLFVACPLLAEPTQVPVIPSDLGQSRLFKPVTFSGTLAGTIAYPFVDTGVILKPYAPCDVGGGPDGSGNVAIHWTRRTRVGGTWADLVDVPLSESTELYVVQIWDSTFQNIARVITGLTSPTCTYTAAQQTTDFGATQKHIYCTIGQVGSYGLGTQAAAVIPGAGASDGTVGAPVPPYGGPPPQGGSTCPSGTQNDTATYNSSVNQLFINPFGLGQTWCVKFTTNTNPGKGTINVVEYLGPPSGYTMYISASPCGAALPGSYVAGEGVSLAFWNGPGNPHPTYIVQLAESTTYYINIVNTVVDTASLMNFQGT